MQRQGSFSQAEYAGKKRRTRRDKFLAEMEQVVPPAFPTDQVRGLKATGQALARLVERLRPLYPTGERGRPPIGLERMLRIYFLQQWYGLADEALGDARYDSQALRGFAGIDLAAESVPDATTVLHFRHWLERHDLTRVLFDEVGAMLEERGLLMRQRLPRGPSAHGLVWGFSCQGHCGPRGACHWRGRTRHKLVFGRSGWIGTMMQSCASAAELRGGGSILDHGTRAMSVTGAPPPRFVICGSSLWRAQKPLGDRPQDDALRHFAGGDQSPQRDQELARQGRPREGGDHRLAGGAAGIGGAHPEPLRQHAVLLEHQEAPSQLQHAAAHARIACPGQAFLTAPGAAFFGRSGQPAPRVRPSAGPRTGSTGHRPAVAQLSCQHLLHQHVGGLDADADDARQQANHALRRVRRGLPQPLQAGAFDLGDLRLHQLQPGTSCRRAMSWRNSATVLGGNADPSGVRSAAKRSDAPGLRRGRPAQGRLEIADAEARQGTLHAVDDAGAFTDQRLVLAARPPGVFRLERRDRRHCAVVALTAQPAQKSLPRRRPGARCNRLTSSRPVLARRCSRDTATLEAWMT